MNLFRAIRGPKRGKVFDLTEFGLEEMTMRRNKKGYDIPAGYTGLIIPYSALENDIIALARKGQQVDQKIYEYGRQYTGN